MIKNNNNIKLGEVAEFRNGVNYNETNFGTGIKIINVANFKDYSKPNYEELSEINPNELIKEDDLLQNGDIVFVRSNGNKNLIGRTLYIDEIEDELTYSAFCIRARFISEECNPRFYAYLFKTNLIRQTLSSQGNGTNISNLNQKILNNLVVPKPSIEKQNKIVSILSKYDDLIENNIKRIKLLEEIAELVYKEWFVNLRFPGYEKCSIVDGIPLGWQKSSVKNILLKHKRKTKVKKEFYLEKGDVPVIDQSRSFIGGYTNDKNVIEENIPAIIFGDHTRVVKYIDFKFASGADGTQLIYSNDYRLSQEYLYFAIKNIDLSNYAYARHFKYLKQEEIYIPNESIVEQFTRNSKDILSQISILRNQNEKLKEARDILIPRLISGEIEV